MADKKAAHESRFGAGEVTLVDRLCEELSGPNRRIRQEASHTLAKMAEEHPDTIEAQVETVSQALVDALFRPEAQTRWEALDTLSLIAASHPDLVEEAFEGAEASLFDDSSSRVRISSFRLLARLGAVSEEKSDKVWPLLDEAIQCFHGDPGYRDMLTALLGLAQGKASAATKKALAGRISFDAESGRGYVKTLSAQIVEAAGK